MRGWYLRRAVPWTALAVCSAVATLLVGAVHPWPAAAPVLLPYALAATAAGAGFLFDDAAQPVVAVTARGQCWRVATRLGLVVLPAGLWWALVLSLPRAALIEPGALITAGVAACMLAAGVASVLARAGVERPGPHLGAALVGATTLPFVVGSMLGWAPVFPVGPVPAWVRLLWWAFGVAGVVLAVLAFRRTPPTPIRLRWAGVRR